jgi:hypothetical protein
MDAIMLADATELSEASYRTLIDEEQKIPFIDPGEIKDALIVVDEGDKGFSDTQANAFIDESDIIHQTDLPALNIFGSGFSATLFRRKTPDANGEYKFSYAIRGTEGLFSKDAAFADVSIIDIDTEELLASRTDFKTGSNAFDTGANSIQDYKSWLHTRTCVWRPFQDD